ncbi:MAG: cation:proton antiporter, partial [Planctomycetota bacterium]
MTPSIPIYLAGVLALGVVAQWIAWRVRLPAIVLLLALGFAIGFAFGPPEQYVGDDVVLPMVSLAVGVILFEGGLSLELREVKETGGVVTRLVTVGLLVTWAGCASLAHWLMGFAWPMALLLGALLTVSGPTVVLPLLRQVRPQRRIGSVIKWEGIVNDPIGAVLAALVFEAVLHSAGGHTGESGFVAGESLANLGKTLLVGLAIGGGSAALVIQMLRRFLAPDYLQNPLILGLVVVTFAASNALQEESGLVTVTVMGLILANQPWVTVKHIVEFKETLRVLLISVLFLVLTSRVRIGWEELADFGVGGFAFVAAVIVLVRPAAVGLATVGSDLSKNERALLGWVHPRGIVAAAVASIFAARFEESPLAGDAERMVLATFLVIVGTVLVYGLTLGPLARRLGLAGGDPQGLLFVGASPMVREIAKALGAEGFETVLVDTNPTHIRDARMAGLGTCYGSIGSEFVHQRIDLADIGRLAAMTPNDEINSLAVTEFAEQFGTANCYQLAPQQTSERHERVPAHRRGRVLFADGVTFDELESRFATGATIKKTTLTEGFTIDDFRAKYPSSLILFTIPERGSLTVSVAGR